MWTEATIAAVAAGLGGVGTALAAWLRKRGANGHKTPVPKVCVEHKALNQTVIGIKEDVTEVKETLRGHEKTLTDIGRSTSKIEGILEGWKQHD